MSTAELSRGSFSYLHLVYSSRSAPFIFVVSSSYIWALCLVARSPFSLNVFTSASCGILESATYDGGFQLSLENIISFCFSDSLLRRELEECDICHRTYLFTRCIHNSFHVSLGILLKSFFERIQFMIASLLYIFT